MGIKLVTFNFLHGGSARRRGHWGTTVHAFAADVLFCQEAGPPPAELTGAGFLTWSAVPGMSWGSGLWIRGREALPVTIAGYDGWIAAAACEIGGHPTLLCSIHCPSGAGGYASEVHRILDAITRQVDGMQVVLAGDFNVAVGYRPADDPVSFFKAERQLLDRMTHELALVPCWQHLNSGATLAQTLRWSRNRGTPYHCDGIFVPRSWARSLNACHVAAGEPWETLSDHNPVVAELDEPVLALHAK